MLMLPRTGLRPSLTITKPSLSLRFHNYLSALPPKPVYITAPEKLMKG